MKKLNILFKKASAGALMIMMSLTLVPMLSGTLPVAKAAGAHEYDPIPCYDITGSSTAENVSGVPNSGVMDFDDVGVAATYQGCVRMASAAVNAAPDHLEGWVWDSNLGWVSLYCNGGTNLGVACGAYDYSVTFATTAGGYTPPDFSTVKLTGYAWGDNIGYISFKDTVGSYFQVQPIANGVNNGLVDVATKGASASYAWADSVGWFNLNGVHMYWYDTDPPIPGAANVTICSSTDTPVAGTASTPPSCTCNLASGCVPAVGSSTIPKADNLQNYTINVPMIDGGVKLTNAQVEKCTTTTIAMGTQIPGTAAYCGEIIPVWSDDVDFDQTTAQSQYANTISTKTAHLPEFSGSTGVGPVSKPLNGFTGAAPFTYDGTAGNVVWKATVKSKAPTSDQNSFGGLNNEKFYYPDTAGKLGNYDPSLTNQNPLVLKGLSLILFKYGTSGNPGTCVYGTVTGTNCTPQNYYSNINIGFKPLISTTQLDFWQPGSSPAKPLNFINVSDVGQALKFTYTQSTPPAEAVSPTSTGFTDLSANQLGANTADYYLAQVPGSTVPYDRSTQALNQFSLTSLAQIPTLPDIWEEIFSPTTGGTSFTSTEGPYLYTKYSYTTGGNQVTYFGGKLPRIKGGLLLNPVAKVQGNVYATDLGQKASDFTIRSLGNVSSNLRREVVVRNVSKYTSGKTITVSSGDHVVANLAAVPNTITELVPNKVYYVKGGDITLNCGATCSFDHNITFIADGGNVYVKSDLKSTNGTSQIGLIALRDLTSTSLTKGFIYAASTIGWLNNTQMYADRLFASYDVATAAFDTNGLPKMAAASADDYGRQAVLANQLVLEGTLSSQNGIGNASRATPVDETGAPISPITSTCTAYNAATLSGICRARTADLNYLRYFGPGLEICTGAEGGTGAVANVPKDQALKAVSAAGFGCNPNYATYSVDASDLYANNPATDLVSGVGGGTKSAYFTGKPDIIANDYPVNFFYKPIAKDLAGFEVDQNFNQSVQN